MRETKKIVTGNGYEIELYTYLTGREAREISNIFLAGMNFQMDETGKTKTSEINASLATSAQDKTIELLVVSVNGKKEEVLKSVLDLPSKDFNELAAELDKIQNGLSAEKKTN